MYIYLGGNKKQIIKIQDYGQHQGKQGVPARQRLGKSSERLRLQSQTVCSRYPRNAPHAAAKPLQVGKGVYRGHGRRDTQLR